MTTAARGDVWRTDFGRPLGRERGFERPAVVVSADRLHQAGAGVAVVVPLSSTRRGSPFHIEVEPSAGSGLMETSYIRCEDVRSVSDRRLVTLLGRVDGVALVQVEAILRRLLGL